MIDLLDIFGGTLLLAESIDSTEDSLLLGCFRELLKSCAIDLQCKCLLLCAVPHDQRPSFSEPDNTRVLSQGREFTYIKALIHLIDCQI